MTEHRWSAEETTGGTPQPQATVARAVQRMAAGGVKRAALPLAGLLVLGAVQLFREGLRGPGGPLLFGGVSSALVMLAYGVQTVRRVLGRGAGAWAPLFWVASWIPYVYGLWVAFFLGLRPLAGSGFGGGVIATVIAVLLTVFGALLVRAQWKLSEIHLLAQEMADLVPKSDGEPWRGE